MPLFGVKHAVADGGHVSLSVGHVLNVHVSSDCREQSIAELIIHPALVVCAATQEKFTVGAETQRPHLIAWKRFKSLEWPHRLRHLSEVPDFDSVVTCAACEHVVACEPFNCNRCDCFVVRGLSRKGQLCFERQQVVELVPVGFIVLMVLLWFFLLFVNIFLVSLEMLGVFM